MRRNINLKRSCMIDRKQRHFWVMLEGEIKNNHGIATTQFLVTIRGGKYPDGYPSEEFLHSHFKTLFDEEFTWIKVVNILPVTYREIKAYYHKENNDE